MPKNPFDCEEETIDSWDDPKHQGWEFVSTENSDTQESLGDDDDAE